MIGIVLSFFCPLCNSAIQLDDNNKPDSVITVDYDTSSVSWTTVDGHKYVHKCR